MTADREQVNSKFFRADTVFSVCLDRIYMNDRIWIFFFYNLCCVPKRGTFTSRKNLLHSSMPLLNGTNFVIDHHHGNKDRILTDRITKFIQ